MAGPTSSTTSAATASPTTSCSPSTWPSPRGAARSSTPSGTGSSSRSPTPNGRVTGFVGRDTSGHPKAPKYRNPTRTPVFDKSSCLYRPTKTAVPDATVIVVEGPIDALAVTAAAAAGGLTEQVVACSTLGTTVSPAQARQVLGISTEPPVIALDGDPAGREGTLRWVDAICRHADRLALVTHLPDGLDPAEWLARHGPAGLAALDPAQRHTTINDETLHVAWPGRPRPRARRTRLPGPQPRAHRHRRRAPARPTPVRPWQGPAHRRSRRRDDPAGLEPQRHVHADPRARSHRDPAPTPRTGPACRDRPREPQTCSDSRPRRRTRNHARHRTAARPRRPPPGAGRRPRRARRPGPRRADPPRRGHPADRARPARVRAAPAPTMARTSATTSSSPSTASTRSPPLAGPADLQLCAWHIHELRRIATAGVAS